MKNSKIKSLVLIDIALIPIFIGVSVTGIKLHIATDDISMWMLLHIVFAALSLIVGSVHIYQHWSWYKGLFNRTKAKRCRLTIALSVLFVVVVLSGLLAGVNPVVGVLHHKLGVLMTLISFIHIAKRFKWLVNNCTK